MFIIRKLVDSLCIGKTLNASVFATEKLTGEGLE